MITMPAPPTSADRRPGCGAIPACASLRRLRVDSAPALASGSVKLQLGLSVTSIGLRSPLNQAFSASGAEQPQSAPHPTPPPTSPSTVLLLLTCSSEDEGDQEFELPEEDCGSHCSSSYSQPLGPILPGDSPRTVCIKHNLEKVRQPGQRWMALCTCPRHRS